ncbi:curli production assembly/transport component CsgG [Hymenobacter busanensis]|uniref:Curli production assembly/transport component CsgG n=1 Tax=Hymenobacter busanensis TaxID=2607656 RepID=A0A7L4ZRR9_9BACT|nr:CsgG/HfaB family protein [Hymenobacter busanensis]KAA9327178.1 curli production assembly/transport component CsgG [Hymenobacter busanensis]QHJ05844.1 curli production assembly/transport component CsgG [Hymenobacter busanensis]
MRFPVFTRRLLAPLALLLTSSCASYFHQPLTTEKARLGAEVRGSAILRSLPAPQERVVVAVYKFRDQTGQYKPTANGSSFSTAVTQGATSIMLRALEESRWFDPIERENLGNLLNERKIIRSSRAEYSDATGQKEPALPPLLFAGVILEGGIISYDANMLTGGAGLRYFGAGASGQYRQDRVTVYLRAISTSNGEILKTVYTSKTILSQQVDASLFQFVSFKRLLETETGFTYNEPSEMAVKEAIEKSVQALVIEGIQEGLWLPRDPADRNGRAVTEYVREKQENQSIDVLGRALQERRSSLGIGLTGAAQRYSGDFSRPQVQGGAELTLRYGGARSGRLVGVVNLGRGTLGAGDFYRETFNYAELAGHLRLFPEDKFTPYLLAGGGLTTRSQPAFGRTDLLPHMLVGMGMEVMPFDRLGIHLGIDNHYYLSDRLDRMTHGKYNDYYWSVRAGVVLYIGGRKSGPIPAARSTSVPKLE